MAQFTANGDNGKRAGAVYAACCAVLVFVLLSVFALPFGERLLKFNIVWAAVVGLFGYAILKTGRMAAWRSGFFITLAAGFLLQFKFFNAYIPAPAAVCGQGRLPPYCHIAIASSALNYLYQQYLALASGSWRLWGPLTLGALWLAATLALGQAWCSWACFYGGIDEGFSKLLPAKWRILRLRVSGKVRDFPAGLLLFLLLISVAYMLPVFCLWLCPLKMTHAFSDGNPAMVRLQIIFLWVAGLGFVVLIPLLSGKRTFCGLICPFGAWQAFWGRINPFRIKVNRELCVKCGECAGLCPVFAINRVEGGAPQISAYCNRCAKCVDACPNGAIGWDLAWSGGIIADKTVRLAFLFCALLVGGMVGMLFMPAALDGVWRALIQCL